MRSGLINIANDAGVFRFAGVNGDYWSSHSGNTTLAYMLLMNSSVTPSFGPSGYLNGRSLRCLSTVLDI